MSFIIKEVFIIIGIIALGILITLGVEEIRFRSMKRALTTEIKILQETNQDLQTKNADLIEQIRTLKSQLEARTQKYERRISQLEEEVKTLQETNQNLQAKNADLIEQMRTPKAQVNAKTGEHEGKISRLEEEVQGDKTASKNTEALTTEVRILQKKNHDLQAINDDLIEQMRTLKAKLETKIRILPDE